MGHRLALIFFLMLSSVAFSQTYTVLNETTGTTFVDTLDGTTEFRFSVRMTGASGSLTGIVPELVPPACAQQGGQPIFNTTFMGIVGGSTTNLAIPTWSNSQTRELIFRVHMFNNSVVCGGAPPCSGGIFNFQLRFTHSSNPNPATASDPSDFLDIAGPPTDGFRVIETVSETQASACTFYIGNNRRIPVTYFGFPESLKNDPDVKVLLGIDWNLNINNVTPTIDFAFGVSNFFYPTGPGINDAYMLKSAGDFDPRVPPVPQDTVILDENNIPFPMGELGGDGPHNAVVDCTEQTWNFFDITDERTVSNATPPIINNLDPTEMNQITMSDSVTQINFRKAGIYLVKQAGCQVSTAFGNPPTQIQFDEYNLLPGGLASVSLSLPASWTTAGGSQLSTSYTIEWYYKSNNTLTRATLPGGSATAPRNLTTNLAVPFSDASDFVIEARIRRVGSNAIVSFQSPGHDLTYSQLAFRSFENAEFNPTSGLEDPDVYLDPGEVLVQELRVQNLGSFATNISVTAGRISPASADIAFGGREKTTFFVGGGSDQQVFQTNLGTNANFDLDVLFELLQVDQACGDIDFFVEVSYVNQGMTTMFRHEFSSPSNCDFVENAFSLDGTWVDAENFGSPPCTDSNCPGSSVTTSSPTQGWGFTDPEWVGSTGTRAFFYTLTSPIAGFPVGLESKIAMRHQATFRLLDAGGIVEYRTRNNTSGWSSWQDLIEPLETRNGLDLYNTRLFTISSGVDDVIKDRSVFMDMTSEQTFDLPLPMSTLTQDLVQFRFLYHLVNEASIAPGLWQVSEFDFKTKLPQFDDLFRLGNDLMFNACNPTIQLTPTPPGSYTYFWYTSFDNLVDDVVHTTSTNGIWDFPIPPASTEYFVKVQLDSPGTVRVYKLNIEATTTVPPFGTVIAAWNTVGAPGNTDVDSSGMVDIVDVILQIILDDCD